MKRKAAYLVAKSEVRIMEEMLPGLKEGQVLIRVHAVGICGSDVSYYTKGATGMGAIQYPHILGHECAGEVVEAGTGHNSLKPGDRVAVEPGVPCGACEYCRSGRYHLCESMAFMSSAVKKTGGEGGMAEYIIRPSDYVYRIPDSMSYEQAAMIEPLSVAMHAVERSGAKPGQNAAILGCGPIAGCLLLVLTAYGIGHVWMTDLVKERAAFMKQAGASGVFQTGGLGEEELKNLLPEAVDVVFDTTCNERAVNASMHWIKKGGVVTLVGVPSEKKEIDIQTAFVRELSLITTFRYSNTYPAAISLIAAGRIRPEPLISHRFPLEDADFAMRTAAGRGSGVMKVMLKL